MLLALVLFSACSNHDYHYYFYGEGDYWEGEYSMIGTKVLEEQNGRTTYTDKNSDDFAITYKGPLEDLSSLQSLEYSFSHSAGGVSTLEDYDRPPVEATFESIGGIKDGMKISRNEVIHVHVMWDDAEESFELRRASK